MKRLDVESTLRSLWARSQQEQRSSLQSGNKTEGRRGKRMSLVNNVELSGWVVTEPKVMGKDRNAGRFRLRFDKNRKVGENWEKDTYFFSVVIFGGDNVERMMSIKKGDKVLVVGKLQSREYEGKEYTDIIANEFALIDADQRPARTSVSSVPDD